MAVNVDKAKNAINSAKTAINEVMTQTVAAGQKDPTQFNALQHLGRANIALDKALERLDEAVDKTTTKVKEEKKGDEKKK